jgi:bla regulator protein blaR1
MNWPVSFLSENLVDAIGWTLLHSLWQGVLLGGVLFIIFRLNREISPWMRYNLSVFVLFAMPVAALITFRTLYVPNEEGEILLGTTALPTAGSGLLSIMGANTSIPVIERLTSTFNWLIPLWFLGVLLFATRLTGGLFLTIRMRREGVSALEDDWIVRFKILQSRTGIRRGIRFLQSIKIQVPSVSGIIKPVILLPTSMLSGMPVEQIEAVIVHELAHIKRYDFMVNILQTLIEAIFFYHPLVWLISGQIRRDREKCCDDFAISVCGKISIYARALAGISETRSSSPIPAVALSNNKKQIVRRVERLLKSKKMKKNANEKWVAGIIIIASAFLITVSTGAALNKMHTPSFNVPVTEIQVPSEHDLEMELNPPVVLADPIPLFSPVLIDTSSFIDIRDNVVTRGFRDKNGNKKDMRFVIKNGKVMELYIDGERIPDDEMSDYSKETDLILNDLSDMENDLQNARKELEGLNIEKIKQEMDQVHQFEMQEIQEEMRLAQKEILENIDREALKNEMKEAMKDIQIDHKKMQEEMKLAMEDMDFEEEKIREIVEQALESMQDIDYEKIEKTIHESMKKLEEIDYEEIEKSIEESLKKLENIDFVEMEEKMIKAMENLEKENFHLDREKEKLDEMIKELEKLELKEE